MTSWWKCKRFLTASFIFSRRNRCRVLHSTQRGACNAGYYDLLKICPGWQVGWVPSEMLAGELPLGHLQRDFTCDPPLTRSPVRSHARCTGHRWPNCNTIGGSTLRRRRPRIHSVLTLYNVGHHIKDKDKASVATGQKHRVPIGEGRIIVNCQLSVIILHARWHDRLAASKVIKLSKKRASTPPGGDAEGKTPVVKKEDKRADPHGKADNTRS
ncbi:hypothetical protein GGR55DRAFT_73647 [Xylaria sp. FL0064]|nr:hypothetical protein GGR55DRAFT_73647 [Xylaria sp. FL0064]